MPNRKKNVSDHATEFDKEKNLVDGVTHEDSCSPMPSSAISKQSLKEAQIGQPSSIICTKTKVRGGKTKVQDQLKLHKLKLQRIPFFFVAC